MSTTPDPDAEELAARLRAHLAEVLRMLGQPTNLGDQGYSPTRRQAMRAQRRNRRAVSFSGLTNE